VTLTVETLALFEFIVNPILVLSKMKKLGGRRERGAGIPIMKILLFQP
jgi:hypothetical protein